VLRILARDPGAHIVLLPSDHFVTDERVLERAVRDAIGEVDHRPERLVLLGIVPDNPDTEFGWIVPEAVGGYGVQPVKRFVEKPVSCVAAELMRRGGVWNSFILATTGRTLVELFEEKLPGVIAKLRDVLAREPGSGPTETLARAYDGLDSFDFCRDVLEGQEDRLSVLPVPHCGWSDLGTPERVARCVERIPSEHRSMVRTDARLDLAQAALSSMIIT
jgi:mannose-1-phosphate guanylyltransferase